MLVYHRASKIQKNQLFEVILSPFIILMQEVLSQFRHGDSKKKQL